MREKLVWNMKLLKIIMRVVLFVKSVFTINMISRPFHTGTFRQAAEKCNASIIK